MWVIAAAAVISNAGLASAARRQPAPSSPLRDLPDSVLAVVGHDRQVTVSKLRRLETAGPSSPDSLTPQQGREFLERLIDREVIAEAAMAERRPWSHEDSARFGIVRDHLVVAAALDSALATVRRTARDGQAMDDERLGPALRDSSMRRLAPRFDQALLERLAVAWKALPRPSSDSSLAAQIRTLEVQPRIAAADSLAVIARSAVGDYRSVDLLQAWKSLSPAYRPRVESAIQLQGLVENALFERELRLTAERQGFERRPDIAALLASERERIAVEHYLQREVLSRVQTDAAGLERFFSAHRDRWTLPLRVRLMRLTFDDRIGADRIAEQLRDAAAAESLAVRSRRRGLDYVTEVSATSDSALFHTAIAAGAGVVLGPDRVDGTWRVVRVIAIAPGRPAELAEVPADVERQWFDEQGRELLDALVTHLRETVAVRTNRKAVEALAEQR